MIIGTESFVTALFKEAVCLTFYDTLINICDQN